MKELVGYCQKCEKKLYCFDGFFHGVHTDNHTLLCFECAHNQGKQDIDN